jgi:hypothetical protein
MPGTTAKAKQPCDRRTPTYVRNLLIGNYYTPPPPGRPPFRYLPFFLYGELLAPDVLARVLDLREPPKLRLASVIGFRIVTWHGRSVLVRHPSREPVRGAVFDGVLDAAMEMRLEAYMTADLQSSRTPFCRADDGGDDGKRFAAKLFVLSDDWIRYNPDGTASIMPSRTRFT